jgi:hypothetical protein
VTALAERGTVTKALLGLVRDDTDEKVLAGRICQACVAGFDIDGAAISLLTASVFRQTLWATDPVAERLEELQFSLNEGACIEAASTGTPVLVADLQDSTETARWPIFAAAVSEQTDVGALFALPLQWGAVNLGVLDMYRLVPGALDDVQWRDALSAADTAALMMLAQRTDPGEGAGGWLDQAVSRNAEIHQATGMVLAQLDVSPPDALAWLRAYAFVHQRLLIDVARDVIGRRLVITEDMM